jgi:hypothetical protein
MWICKRTFNIKDIAKPSQGSSPPERLQEKKQNASIAARKARELLRA